MIAIWIMFLSDCGFGGENKMELFSVSCLVRLDYFRLAVWKLRLAINTQTFSGLLKSI